MIQEHKFLPTTHLPSYGAKMSMSLPALVSIGGVVQLLSLVNARGSVVMRFDRCAYLQFQEQLICIGLNELGASSISGLFDNTVRALPPHFAVGAKATLTTQDLLIDDQYSLDLAAAVPYESSLREDVSRFGSLVVQHELLAILSKPEAGFAPLLHRVCTASSHCELTSVIDANSASTESELLCYVLPAIAQLTDQIRVCCGLGDAEVSQYEFDTNLFIKIIGAGPGLTPSGDDFLCGVFAALHLSGFSEVANNLWASIRSIATRSTTQVSVALLEQAAAGEAGERLDLVISAYLGYPATTADQTQRLIDLVGQTSGWDWLTGFVLCVDTLSQSRELDRLAEN